MEKIDDSKLFEYAVRGMLEGLDPHSAYLTKEDYSDLQTTTEGEFSGLGIEIQTGTYGMLLPMKKLQTNSDSAKCHNVNWQ